MIEPSNKISVRRQCRLLDVARSRCVRTLANCLMIPRRFVGLKSSTKAVILNANMLPTTVQFIIAMIASAITDRMARKRGLKLEIGRTTVANMLAEAGLDPAPERKRKRTWARFLKSHWDSLYASDFFSVEILSVFGTVRHMVFLVMHIKTRGVHIAGIRVDPNGDWMHQVARNLTDPIDGFLRRGGYLVHDRDPVFTHAWTKCLREAGIKCVRIPAQSPNCNFYAERFVRTIRQECLQQFVISGEAHLRHIVGEFVARYNGDRYHQGLGGKFVTPKTMAGNDNGEVDAIKTRSRLGGTLNFYHCAAA